MNRTLKDQLNDYIHQHPELSPKKNKPSQKPQKRRTEHLTESDIKSLMNMNMPKYSRHKGALRQK